MPLPVTGYVAPRLNALILAARQAIRNELGATLQLESSAIGAIIDTCMARLDELAEAAQDLFDSFDERAATGIYLDNLCSLVGVTRIEATTSEVDLTLGTTGGAPVVVPAGSSVADAGGVEWLLQAAVTIPAFGSISGTFSPAVTGPIAAAIGALDVPGTGTIKTPVAGWDTVTQAAAATPGRDRETDAALRLRRRQSLAITGAANTESIRAALLASDYVGAAKVVDNKTGTPIVVGGVTLPAHSYLAVVVPDPTTVAARQEIGEIIWQRAPAGIQSTDATGVLTTYPVSVTDEGGATQIIYFSAGASQLCPVAIELTVDVTAYGNVPGAGGAGDTAVKTAVINAIAQTQVAVIGEDPTLLAIYQWVGAVAGVLDITTLTIGALPLSEFEVAFTNVGAITITPTP